MNDNDPARQFQVLLNNELLWTEAFPTFDQAETFAMIAVRYNGATALIVRRGTALARVSLDWRDQAVVDLQPDGCLFA